MLKEQYIKFKMNYLPDIFSDISQKLERGFHCEIFQVKPEVNTRKSEEEYSTVFDINIAPRIKESFYRERYKIVLSQFKNTQMLLSAISEITEIEFESGEAWQISNITADIINEKEELWIVEIEFSKHNNTPYSLPYASDNLYSKFLEGLYPMNIINVTVKNPTLQFPVTFIFGNDGTYDKYYFTIPRNDLTSFIKVGDIFGVHAKTIDIGNIMFSDFIVTSVNATEIILFDYEYVGLTDSGTYSDIVTIDSIANRNSGNWSVQSDITDRYLTYNIYTAIHKKIDLDELKGEEVVLANMEKRIDKISFTQIMKVPFFLKLNELWKYEYLRCANVIKYYEAQNSALLYNNIIASTDNCFDIAEQKDIEYFNQKEYLLKLPIEQISLPITY